MVSIARCEGGICWSEPIIRTSNRSTNEMTKDELYDHINHLVFTVIPDLINNALMDKYNQDNLPALTDELRQLWRAHHSEFIENPTLRSGDVIKLACHIFNLYRRKELVPILQNLKTNPSPLGISFDDWQNWERLVIKWAWHYMGSTHSSRIIIPLTKLLQLEFPSIPLPANLESLLAVRDQETGLPELRPEHI